MKEKLAAISVWIVLAAVPVLVLVAQGIYRPSRSAERIIDITGVGSSGAWTLETVNGLNYWWKSFEPATIHIQLNEQVVLRLLSADVFHQFYVPALGIGPVDIEPGHVKEILFKAELAGIFMYYCTAMCGGCHFYMQGWIVVTPAGEEPITPPRIICPLCLPTFTRPAEDRFIELGEYLYQTMGCVSCHGIEGRGGVKNYNYIKETVPAHNRTAEKVFLIDPDDRETFLKLIEEGVDLNSPDHAQEIARQGLIVARFNAAVELIMQGKRAERMDINGPAPPLQMPSWKIRLTPREIHAILGYFISLSRDRDEEDPPNSTAEQAPEG